MKIMLITLSLSLAACDGSRDEVVEKPAVSNAVDELGYPVKQPDGARLTADFCNTEQAQRIYDNLKTCSMVACKQGDRESCQIAQTFATQHAPSNLTEDRKLERMDYMQARSIIHEYGWRATPGECVGGVDEATCRQFPEIGNCSGTGMGFCDMHFTKRDRCLSLVTVGGPPDGTEDGEPSVRDVQFSRAPCHKDPNEGRN